MKTAYQWATGYPAPKGVSAKLAGSELERIRRAHKGALRPEMVLEASRHKNAPLHAAFEWDNTKAAAKWRLKQARDLIGAVVTVEIEDKRTARGPVRAFVHVNTKDEGSHYTTTAAAMGDAEMRAQLLGDALGEIQSWRKRYDQLKELVRIYEAIDATVSGVERDGQKRLVA